ncbi:phage holin family protein [Gordonia sp. NPDC003376]
MRAFLIRTVFTGLSLWIATLIVPGLFFVWDVDDATWQKVGIVFFVALVFGVINSFIKPIVQILSIPLYILTLGLIHIIINALMIELTSWFTRNTTGWGLEVDSFWWSAVFGAIVISVVGWLIALVMKEPEVYRA